VIVTACDTVTTITTPAATHTDAPSGATPVDTDLDGVFEVVTHDWS
jgi:hypothetical protein